MQVAIVYYYDGEDSSKLKDVCGSLSKGLERQGLGTEIIDGRKQDDKKLTIYDYMVFVTVPCSSFSSRLPSGIKRYLENAGKVSGKRTCAIVTGGFLFRNKALQNLMKVLESEGIILIAGEVITKNDVAEAYGLHIRF